MIQIHEEPVTILYSPNIPYMRVDLSGFYTFAQAEAGLSMPKLFDLITEKKVTGILLNFSNAYRFGTAELDWLSGTWLSKAQTAGIERVSVVVTSEVYNLMQLLFAAALAKLDPAGRHPQVRFFDQSQFYDGWEAVAWFNDARL